MSARIKSIKYLVTAVFPDKTKKKLLYLAGTLPVCYEGKFT